MRHVSTTSYAYDALNRQTEVIQGYGTAIATTGTMIYDAASNLLSETDGQSTTSTYAHVSTTSYGYDALNRQVTTIAGYGSAVQQTSTVGYDAASNAITSTDALSLTTTMTFDALNREISVLDPANDLSTTVYDSASNVLATVDANHDRTTYGYDALNRQVTETDADLSVTTMVFDVQGNQTVVIDADGNPTTMTFDALNRVTQTASLQSGTTTYAYDLGGRLISTTDADAQRRDIAYDALNRETGETWHVSGSVVNTLTYTYDAASNLLTAGDIHGTYTYTLDALNRQTTQQDLFGTTLTMSYDAASNRVQVLDSFGGTTTSGYDALNRLTSRGLSTTGGVALHVAQTWTAENEVATQSRYDDEGTSVLVGTSSYGYDTAERLTQLWHKDGSGNVLASYVYSFDPGSRLTQQVVDGTSTTYSYDQTSQLTQAGSATYGYDATGNRTNTGYATTAGNQMTNDGTWTYTYDAKGQLIEKSKGPAAETWTFGYDLRGQMTWAADRATPGGTLISLSSYVYDVFGNRVEEDVWTATSGVTIVSRQAYDGANAWADLDGSNALVERHLFLDGPNQVFAAVTAGGTVTWDLADRLGSVADVVNFAGTTDLDRITYDAYGNFTETDDTAGDVYKWEGGRLRCPDGADAVRLALLRCGSGAVDHA